MTRSFSFGRFPSPPDPRDWRLRDFLRVPTDPMFEAVATFWGLGPTLDQGDTVHCVGFSGAHWSNAAPVENEYVEPDAHALYYECKVIDGQPDRENGTYIRSLAKALRARQRVDGYAFGTVEDARLFLLTEGPVILGVDWYEGMCYPGTDGLIIPWGPIVGGHAVIAYGADERFCYLQNSWGYDWGCRGGCRISWGNLEFVFRMAGEAMTAVELPLPEGPVDLAPPPTPPSPRIPWLTRLWRWLCRVFG